MKSSESHNCEIVVPDDLAFPEYANAFRILPETGDDCILEFLVFSAQDNRAKAVARIRVRADFLRSVQHRLSEVLKPPDQGQRLEVREDGLAVSKDGQMVYIYRPPVGEEN